jgi:hypothetical protein
MKAMSHTAWAVKNPENKTISFEISKLSFAVGWS